MPWPTRPAPGPPSPMLHCNMHPGRQAGRQAGRHQVDRQGRPAPGRPPRSTGTRSTGSTGSTGTSCGLGKHGHYWHYCHAGKIAPTTVEIARCASVWDYLTNIQKLRSIFSITQTANPPMMRAVFSTAYIGAHVIA